MINIQKLSNFRTRSRKVEAIPQVLSPGEYDVEISPTLEGLSCPATDDRNGTLVVPVYNSPEGKAVRVHEYAHLAFQLKEFSKLTNKGGVPNICVQAIADVAVNEAAKYHGMLEVTELPLTPCPDVSVLPVEAVATRFLRCLSLNETKRKPIVEEAKKVLTDTEISMLCNMFGEIKALVDDDGKLRSRSTQEILARYAAELASAFGIMEPERTKPKELKEGFDPYDVKISKYAGSRTDGKWIYPTLQYPPRIRDRNVKKRIAHRKVPGFCGPPRNLLRALLPGGDGMAFLIKKREEGGTILLDLSGSMRLERDQVMRLLKIAPAATIAGYSGDYFAVLAMNGEVVENMPHGNTNESDGPCLTWLSKQKHPRIWISDGGVTGIGDHMHQNLNLEAIKIVREGRIMQVRSLDEFYKLVEC